MDIESAPQKRDFHNDFRWDGVTFMPYKQEGSATFKDVSRQVLFQEPGMGCELRYFEVGAGGFSTLEQHEHAHAVMILRGQGHCLLGTEVVTVKPFDLVTIPSWTWHQFRATQGEPLGFLCMVNQDRDRPRLPSAEDLAALRAVPAVAKFLQT
ncbi:MAG TPA: cupin domain-containing protein [Acetobacteraceae bacterium]|nr:cupin domain-containing protein [Acetobacteraceae bacterium]